MKTKQQQQEQPGRMLWCDGNCSLNGRVGAHATAYVYDGVFLQSFPVPGKQTNQRAELYALLKALEACHGGETVCADSLYALNLARGSWRAKVNKDIVIPLREAYRKVKVTLRWVPSEQNPADPEKGREYRHGG